MSSTYIHGTSPREQERLLRQAATLEGVILDGFEASPGEQLLEIGCGVGAVLERIATRFPRTRLTGIDISPEQVETARRHLAARGVAAELVAGDAARLPFPDHSFDRVVMVWVIEHLPDPMAVLRGARRVLRPGGMIHLTETDYDTIRTSPPDPAIRRFLDAFVACFDSMGDAHAGPRLGGRLEAAGFGEVEVRMVGVHAWCPSRAPQIRGLVDYLLEFIRPELPRMLEVAPAADHEAIHDGLLRFERLADRPDGAISASIYKGLARVP